MPSVDEIKTNSTMSYITIDHLRARGAQWLSERVLDSRPKGRGFEHHRRYCIVSSSKNINPSLVLVQPRKTRPYITERLLMGRKESNETKKIESQHSFWKHHILQCSKAGNSESETAIMLNILSIWLIC